MTSHLQLRNCVICHEDKPIGDFPKPKPKTVHRCIPCNSAYQTEITRWRKLWTLCQYSPPPDGPKCACPGCDERRVEFLVIDHINGGGTAHRRQGYYGRSLYKYLRKRNFPSGFRVLCWNCNCSLGMYGQCPHEKPTLFPLELMTKFGETLKGSSKPNSKLTESDVLMIRKEAASGVQQAELARRYGIRPQTMSHIIQRRTWKHVGPDGLVNPPGPNGPWKHDQ